MTIEEATQVAAELAATGMNIVVEVRQPDTSAMTPEEAKAAEADVFLRVTNPDAGQPLPPEVLELAAKRNLSIATTNTVLS